MFSWTNCNAIENTVKHDDVRVLKRSELTDLRNKPKCMRKRNPIASPQQHTKANTTDSQLIHKSNSYCKILDLSPEEKQKIAKLIKELGLLQSEKEQIQEEMKSERCLFLEKLDNVNRIYENTVKEKQRLEQELRKREELIGQLESRSNQINISEDNRCSTNTDQFFLLPADTIQNLLSQSQKRQKIFPGPPRLSRSQEITQSLLHSHESIATDDDRLLMDEHQRLKEERNCLQAVLNQQKYLRTLVRRIAKMEKRLSRVNKQNPELSSDINSDLGNNDNRNVLHQQVLNEPHSVSEVDLNEDDESSLWASSSVPEVINDGNSITTTVCTTPLKINDSYFSPIVITDEEILLIKALNESPDANRESNAVQSNNNNLSQQPSTSTDVRKMCYQNSSTNSLINIIDVVDHFETNQTLLAFDSEFRDSSSIPTDEELFSDLFFTAK